MNIPLNDLSRQYKELKSELDATVIRVMTRGLFTLGPEVSSFEKKFATFIGAKFSVGVGSGTDALVLALKAIDVSNDDEVIIPVNAYPTAFTVALAGAHMKLVDCGTDGNMDPSKLEDALTKKTKAIIPVHLYGTPANLLQINRFILSKSQKIFLVEDCAQAHGAAIQNPTNIKQKSIWKKVGSIGTIGCFSFYPTKNLGAFGDGGMVVTNNKEIAARLMRLRMYGEVSRYKSVEIAGISRLDELQAAILSVKLKYLDRWNRRRTQIASYYQRELDGIGDLECVTMVTHEYIQSVFHLYVVRTNHRDALQAYLAKHGIGTGIHYPTPVHLQQSFKYLGYKKGDFPMAETMSQEILSLPMFPQLTDGEVEKVVFEIKKYYTSSNIKSVRGLFARR